MRRPGFWLAFTAALVCVVSAYVWHHAAELRPGQHIEAPLTLQGVDGPVQLTDWPESLLVVVVGYAHCPDICPMSLTTFAQALTQLPAEHQARLQGVFISVDPARDTPAFLADYVGYFSPRLRGLTGNYEQLQRVVHQLGTSFKTPGLGKEPAPTTAHYTVTHPTNFYLLNGDARLLATLPAHTNAQQLASRLQQALQAL